MFDPGAYEKMDLFYLGREIDPVSGEAGPLPLLMKNGDLTTHAAIIGMTGSGKTGLGICLLEEAALDRIPAIVIDPKGDMGNLLLTFPEMRPADFLPWIDPVKADRKKMTREELAADTAESWKNGLARWGQDGKRIARLRENVAMTVYTPGSSAGRPISVLESLDAPEPSVMEDNDTLGALVNSSVSSILGLAGIDADPLRSREHILLSSVLLHHWRRRQSLNLEALIGGVINPPLDRIGAFPLNSFYPQDRRMALALQLNNILASPSFQGWTTGEPLRIEHLLYTPQGKPRVTIFSIAHLGDPERMFFVTILLGRLLAWLRRQKGSSGLRTLLYMDEIYGYFPPTANPPSKDPMLLLLKQARAYGLGVVLATQNPVDLDYKGLANIGTWFIGRLQTRQDQDKVLTGISGGSEKFGNASSRELLSQLQSRKFLMTSAHRIEPVLFETRWVLSYLKGPISLAEAGGLTSGPDNSVKDYRTESMEIIRGLGAPERTLSESPPVLPPGIDQSFVLPPVPMERFTLVPWLAGFASVRYFNQSRAIDVVENVSIRLLPGEGADVEWPRAADNPVLPEDTAADPPAGARYGVLPAVVSTADMLHRHTQSLSDYLYQNRRLELLRVPALKMESRPGETESGFRKRVADALYEKKEAELEKIRADVARRTGVLEERLARKTDRIEREKSEVAARKMDTALSFGVAVFGALFGRRRASVTTASRSAQGMRSAGRVLKEKEDVRRAEEEAARTEAAIAALAEELREKTVAVSERYAPELFGPEKFFIKPRRTDIFDVRVCIQWEPLLELEETEQFLR
jgi:hypothetical protein